MGFSIGSSPHPYLPPSNAVISTATGPLPDLILSQQINAFAAVLDAKLYIPTAYRFHHPLLISTPLTCCILDDARSVEPLAPLTSTHLRLLRFWMLVNAAPPPPIVIAPVSYRISLGLPLLSETEISNYWLFGSGTRSGRQFV